MAMWPQMPWRPVCILQEIAISVWVGSPGSAANKHGREGDKKVEA
jgi:hypothetical protein